jgi:O-methyltransferase domain/Dimerisation domain
MTRANRRPRAQESMLGLISGYWVSQCLFVVAKLGVADALARGPRAPDAIAQQVGAHAPFLRRVLRALASVGVFAEDAKGRFRLTPLAETLRSDRPGSLRDFTRMMVDDYNWQAWGALEHGVTTGALAFDHVHGQPVFAYLARHPEQERVFAASMASISGTENAAVARAYPFGKLRQLVDVGGAHGHLLAAILRRHKKLRGVLYDQPQVVAGAAQSGFLAGADLAGRHEVRGGSFFDAVPAGADGYVMKYILHDWDDAKCLRILGYCRDAMAENGRVLVVDHVIPKGNGANWGKLLDINMMVLPGGQERTREEFRDLFARAGLRLARVVPTACPLSILEAVRA